MVGGAGPSVNCWIEKPFSSRLHCPTDVAVPEDEHVSSPYSCASLSTGRGTGFAYDGRIVPPPLSADSSYLRAGAFVAPFGMLLP